MGGKTNRFGLQWLEAGEHLSEDGYAFVNADRHLMDRLLELGAEDHHHTGEEAQTSDLDPPELVVDTTSGGLPAGRRVYYRYTLVDGNGFETAASADGYVDTPEPIDIPDASSLTYTTTGGTHIPGVYHYVLSAYEGFTTSESKAMNPAHVTVQPSTNTNEITITLPDLPPGATGFNIYRRGPGRTRYYYLDSVDMDVATPPEDYIDDNAIEEDCDRTLPTSNTTFSTNTVTVSIPGATPSVPDGYTWKIYRTFVADDWDNTLLAWVVEETFEGSGEITPEYDDTGSGTTTGSPPSADQAVGTPEEILLTDMTEVQGYLPPGRNVIPHQITFSFPGSLEVTTGTFIWVCEFERAQIVACRASLGRGFSPASSAVIVDVNRWDNAATPNWGTIYTTQANRPRVEVGDFIGDRTVPNITALLEGDALSVDIDQVGGGATPTDEDLTVTIYMIVKAGPEDVSWTWATD